MSVKSKLGMGIASAALGLSLIGGGTFAYFNDTAETKAAFAAGTLDLNAHPEVVIDVGNLKPGDEMARSFILANNGSLDIAKVLLTTDYTVTNRAGAPENTEDFGKYIRVDFLINKDKAAPVIWSTTLDQLKNMTPDAIEGWIFSGWLAERGGHLKPGTNDEFWVKFTFVDNGQEQNEFQGDTLNLTWTFEGKQGKGVAR